MIEVVNKTGKMMALVTIRHHTDVAVQITVAISHEEAVGAAHKEMAAAVMWRPNKF